MFFNDVQVKGEREVEVGRVALSNLLGSIGYFYGQSLIAIPPEYQVSTKRFLSLNDVQCQICCVPNSATFCTTNRTWAHLDLICASLRTDLSVLLYKSLTENYETIIDNFSLCLYYIE